MAISRKYMENASFKIDGNNVEIAYIYGAHTTKYQIYYTQTQDIWKA